MSQQGQTLLDLTKRLTLAERPRRFERGIIEEGYYAHLPANIFLSRQLDGSDIEEYRHVAFPYSLPDPEKKITLEMIEKEYERSRSYWQDSTGWRDTDWIQELTRTFEVALVESSEVPVTRVVCLGLGAFLSWRALPINGEWCYDNFTHASHRFGAFHQLHALELYVHLIDLHQGDNKITAHQIYLQDPVFTAADEKFLSSKGFTVLKDPEGYNMVTSTTFLYTPYVPSDKQIHALMVDYPVLCVGHDSAAFLNVLEDPKPGMDINRVHHFLRYWSEKALPRQVLAEKLGVKMGIGADRFKERYYDFDDGEPLVLPHALLWKPNEGIEVSKTECSRPEWNLFTNDVNRAMEKQRREEYYAHCAEKGQDREEAKKVLDEVQKQRIKQWESNNKLYAEMMEKDKKLAEQKKQKKEEQEKKE